MYNPWQARFCETPRVCDRVRRPDLPLKACQSRRVLRLSNGDRGKPTRFSCWCGLWLAAWEETEERREASKPISHSTGEARDVRRRKLAEEAVPITMVGKWRGRHPGGGSGGSTEDRRAAKRAGREAPGPVGHPLFKVRQG